MKKINVEQFSLKELDSKEAGEYSGGIAWLIPTALAAGAYLCKKVGDSWQCFKDGLMGRKHDTNKCDK